MPRLPSAATTTAAATRSRSPAPFLGSSRRYTATRASGSCSTSAPETLGRLRCPVACRSTSTLGTTTGPFWRPRETGAPMEFKNEFEVNAPIDQVWEALLDLEKVAPAMPGAQVLEKVDDDNYKVAIKVKVGPMSMQYRGDVEIAEKDAAAHRAVMKVKAREAR